MSDNSGIVGVVLAGGESNRFGSPKSTAMLGDRTLIEHVVTRAAPQVGLLLISANAAIAVKAVAEIPVVGDDIGPARGPLAGILAAMNWSLRHLPDSRWLASFPVDSPLFPTDLVARFVDVAAGKESPVIASSGGRVHPTFGLWPVSLRLCLHRYLIESTKGAATDFARIVKAREAIFPTDPFDPFLNINLRDDLAAAAVVAREFGMDL